MQYFDCCPVAENDAVETTLTTQQFAITSPGATLNNTSYHRRRLMESSPSSALNATKYNSPVNPYHMLELRRDATASEIIGSYRKLALIYHPGRKISCPLERKRRMQLFEVLAACYETLMHSEFRRRCDGLLKDMEKKQNRKSNRQLTRNTFRTADIFPDRNTDRPQSLRLAQKPSTEGLTVKQNDSIPGLIPSQSSSASGGEKSCHSVGNSGESNETILRNNCTSIGNIFLCSRVPETLVATTSENNSFAISRDGKKGFKSLADSSSLSASNSAEEEAEIHFSEATVNRLFGGPLASLHRARNFQAFSDPYLVFDKVFGNQKPIFPHISMTEVDATIEDSFHGLDTSNENTNTTHLQFHHPGLEPFSTSENSHDINENDLTGNTKVFVFSRVVNGRKITKTETVSVDSTTGIASVNVTVDSEYLEPVRSKITSSQHYGTSVADWLLCFGTGKVATATKSATISAENSSPPKSQLCCPKNGSECKPAEKLSSSCIGFKSLYVEALEKFYQCNNNFYEECNKYMRCGR